MGLVEFHILKGSALQLRKIIHSTFLLLLILIAPFPSSFPFWMMKFILSIHNSSHQVKSQSSSDICARVSLDIFEALSSLDSIRQNISLEWSYTRYTDSSSLEFLKSISSHRIKHDTESSVYILHI